MVDPYGWRDRFTVKNANGNTEGFEMADPYGDMSIFSSEYSTDLFCRWVRRKKLIFDLSTDPLLPYFSFFFLILTLPIWFVRNMVMDAMRMNEGNVSQCPIVEEEPNADAARFFWVVERFWQTIMGWLRKPQ